MPEWNVQFFEIEQDDGDRFGLPVSESRVFEVTADDEAEAEEMARALYNAKPEVKTTPEWRRDGNYKLAANVDRVTAGSS